MLKPYIAKVINRQNLTEAESEEAMGVIMSGQATEAQVGGYLVALRMKGETVDEITGSAKAMRKHASKVTPCINGDDLLDTAGTGGDGAHTFNISTTVAFILAGAGKKVAKHGNRAASSKSGSADVLASVGLNLDLTPDQVAACIDEIGIGFLFAPKFHPAMKYAVGPRRELGQRTIFNMLGPLTNPANATHQLIGVYDPALTHPIAEVLGALGGRAAYVVHGAGGLDELTTVGENKISELRDGRVNSYSLCASDYGFSSASIKDLRGGTPDQNARIMEVILQGKDLGPRREIVMLNAAVALATHDGDIECGLETARVSIDSGAAYAKLEELIAFSHRFNSNGKNHS